MLFRHFNFAFDQVVTLDQLFYMLKCDQVITPDQLFLTKRAILRCLKSIVIGDMYTPHWDCEDFVTHPLLDFQYKIAWVRSTCYFYYRMQPTSVQLTDLVWVKFCTTLIRWCSITHALVIVHFFVYSNPFS